jgi:hypothetical protein
MGFMSIFSSASAIVIWVGSTEVAEVAKDLGNLNDLDDLDDLEFVDGLEFGFGSVVVAAAEFDNDVGLSMSASVDVLLVGSVSISEFQ